MTEAAANLNCENCCYFYIINTNVNLSNYETHKAVNVDRY